jgi:putative transposase
MSRYRLLPSPAQETVLRDHCAHARFIWNLAVEQHAHWHPGRKSAPGYLEQCRQLTAARAAHEWLRMGSQVVQQQALRDFPKAGWVRFRWSRDVPQEVKSYRVTYDRAGRWHVAFAAIPDAVLAPGNDQVVGIERGIHNSAALSTGELIRVPGLTKRERRRMRRLERKLARARPGSGRRMRSRLAVARLRACGTDRRKDWTEKVSTDIARRFDVIMVEDLQIRNMTRSAKGTQENPGRNVRQKAGLNRGILRSGWVCWSTVWSKKLPAEWKRSTPRSRANDARHAGRWTKSRESQAVFRCTACGYVCNADVNAAKNIAAGHAVTTRGGLRDAGP